MKDFLVGWIKDLFIDIITKTMTLMYSDVNDATGKIAGIVAKSPQDWNSSIFNLIKNVSDNVVVPVAGMIIAFVLCYELITMIVDRNNLHDLDTWMFFKWIFKAYVAVLVVTHTFDIIMAVFDVGQYLVNGAYSVISSDTAIDVTAQIASVESSLQTMGVGELAIMAMEMTVLSLGLKIISIVITVILYGRMIEIYLYASVGPVPLSTFGIREWGQIGNNYIRTLLALAFQGFFMMIAVGIYCVLIKTMDISTSVHMQFASIAIYTIILCFTLLKTGNFSKQIFGAH